MNLKPNLNKTSPWAHTDSPWAHMDSPRAHTEKEFDVFGVLESL
jgi:hypothetical protein